MTHKLGEVVQQVVPVIKGEIKERRLNESEDQLEYLVSYTGADGEVHERWFLEAEVETAKEAA